jgi:hypothetical protein
VPDGGGDQLEADVVEAGEGLVQVLSGAQDSDELARLGEEMVTEPGWRARWRRREAVTIVVDWLESFPGESWLDRWLVKGSDRRGRSRGPAGLTQWSRNRRCSAVAAAGCRGQVRGGWCPLARAGAAGQEHVEQRAVTVTAQRREQVIQDVIGHRPRLPLGLLLPVSTPAMPGKLLQRVVMSVQPPPVTRLRWHRGDHRPPPGARVVAVNSASTDNAWLTVAAAYPARRYALPVGAFTSPGAGAPGRRRSRAGLRATRSHNTKSPTSARVA